MINQSKRFKDIIYSTLISPQRGGVSGAFKITVIKISILFFSRYLFSSDRRRCSRITTNAKAIQMQTNTTFTMKNDCVERARS